MVLWRGGIRDHGFPFPQHLLLDDVFSQCCELLLEQQFQDLERVTHLGFCSRTLLVI